MEKEDVIKLIDTIEKEKAKKVSDVPKPPKPDDKEEKKIKYSHPGTSKWPYVMFTIGLLFCIAIPFVMLKFAGSFIFFILSLFLCVPLGLFFLIGGIIKTYMDRKRINAYLIKKLTKNFIIAEVFKQNKRKEFKTLKINKDALTASDGDKDYLIDLDAVWYDERNYPHIHYVENIPNGLLFNFQKNLLKFVDDFKKKLPTFDDIFNMIVDISYSSQSLQLLKKDKLVSELHKANMDDKERIAYLILIGVIIGLFVLYLILHGNGNQTIQILQAGPNITDGIVR